MKLPTRMMLLATLAANGADVDVVLPEPRRHEPEPKTPADLERLEAARQKRLRRVAKRRMP